MAVGAGVLTAIAPASAKLFSKWSHHHQPALINWESYGYFPTHWRAWPGPAAAYPMVSHPAPVWSAPPANGTTPTPNGAGKPPTLKPMPEPLPLPKELPGSVNLTPRRPIR